MAWRFDEFFSDFLEWYDIQRPARFCQQSVVELFREVASIELLPLPDGGFFCAPRVSRSSSAAASDLTAALSAKEKNQSSTKPLKVWDTPIASKRKQS